MMTTETRTIPAADLDRLLIDLASEGKTILTARYSADRQTVECVLGPWPKRGTFPPRQRRR